MNAPEYERLVVQLIRRLAHLMYSHSRQMVRRCGLTGPQAVVLETLLRDGDLSSSTLAEKVAVSGGTVTGILDRLEAKGLVDRSRDPGDRRSVVVRATDEAAEWFRNGLSYLNADFSDRFQELTEQEREDILNALHRLIVMLGDPAVPDSLPASGEDLKLAGIPMDELVTQGMD